MILTGRLYPVTADNHAGPLVQVKKETAATGASPPVKAPAIEEAKLTSLIVPPPADMNAHASMKKGTAIKENESIPYFLQALPSILSLK